ncbi:unnamed protein product [Phaedon cochleariae]|uniref:Uncharacterized protein n=1 Tax=Phaedon cochleariae TaxID=80249 RepID=A0A9N9SBR9_PHACE|nr:unnamed protein product [Phaedon cochleariae]
MEDNKDYVLMDMSSENELTSQTELISVLVICRLCANQNDKLIGIYSEDGINNDLANKMNLYLPIKVYETDDLPLQCCWQCASTVLAWHELVVASVEADRRLRSSQFVTTKELQDSINQEVDDNVQQHENEKCQELEDQQETTKPEDQELNNSLVTRESLSKFCNLCDKQFHSKTELKNHMLTCHNLKQSKFRRKKSDINAPFTCPACPKTFTRKFDMHKHIKSKHPTEASTVQPSIRSQNLQVVEKCKVTRKDGGAYFACDICQQEFNDSSQFTRHRKAHFERNTHICKVCGKTFKCSAHLKRHVEHLHRGVKNFTCAICDLKFATKFSLEEHLNIHTDNRPFVCEICGKAFKQKSSLYVHNLYHNDNFPFSCDLCRKRFRRKGDLVVHQRIHTGDKPYGCAVCDKRFRLGHDMKRHLKIHVKNRQT